jgi:hypothetical protein
LGFGQLPLTVGGVEKVHSGLQRVWAWAESQLRGVQCGTAVEKAYKWLNGIACTQIVGICLTGLEERQGARSPDKVEDEASPCECQGDGFTAESVVVEEEEEEWSSRLETRLW